jgi:hypothetical protein
MPKLLNVEQVFERRTAVVMRADTYPPINVQFHGTSALLQCAFERFVFVMLVLEHYSEHECSLLLSCSRQDVIAARNRFEFKNGGNLSLPYCLRSTIAVEVRTFMVRNRLRVNLDACTRKGEHPGRHLPRRACCPRSGKPSCITLVGSGTRRCSVPEHAR